MFESVPDSPLQYETSEFVLKGESSYYTFCNLIELMDVELPTLCMTLMATG